ncbi:hypothetical protein [Streptomyces sp. NPDC126514]|uniref:hypothetical protein n=1 Tax=Streptomyces sp. NPDC126514 TaxID=3155210 RepID=UPI00332D344D
MTSGNPVQDRLDELDEQEASARVLLERTLRLAVGFHRRAEHAAAELDRTIAYLERPDGH